MKLISCQCIWEAGAHNAFTDLVLFNDALFCVFREGSDHVSPDGGLRILHSLDEGNSWETVAFIHVDYADLRDGKLLSYHGSLLLLCGGSLHNNQGLQSHLWHSHDGMHWSPARLVADSGYWLWCLAIHNDSLYGVAYRPGPDGDVRLYKSDDGVDFYPWVETLHNDGYVNEASLLFSQSTTEGSVTRSYCLLRRDPVWSDKSLGLLGSSEPPYQNWRWVTLDKRIGGPILFEYRQRLLAVVRLYDDRIRTSLVEIHPLSGQVDELLALPSGGDTSYAGVVLSGDILSVSYYSSHEAIPSRQGISDVDTKTRIYFATIDLS